MYNLYIRLNPIIHNTIIELVVIKKMTLMNVEKKFVFCKK